MRCSPAKGKCISLKSERALPDLAGPNAKAERKWWKVKAGEAPSWENKGSKRIWGGVGPEWKRA